MSVVAATVAIPIVRRSISMVKQPAQACELMCMSRFPAHLLALRKSPRAAVASQRVAMPRGSGAGRKRRCGRLVVRWLRTQQRYARVEGSQLSTEFRASCTTTRRHHLLHCKARLFHRLPEAKSGLLVRMPCPPMVARSRWKWRWLDRRSLARMCCGRLRVRLPPPTSLQQRWC